MKQSRYPQQCLKNIRKLNDSTEIIMFCWQLPRRYPQLLVSVDCIWIIFELISTKVTFDFIIIYCYSLLFWLPKHITSGCHLNKAVSLVRFEPSCPDAQKGNRFAVPAWLVSFVYKIFGWFRQLLPRERTTNSENFKVRKYPITTVIF